MKCKLKQVEPDADVCLGCNGWNNCEEKVRHPPKLLGYCIIIFGALVLVASSWLIYNFLLLLEAVGF